METHKAFKDRIANRFKVVRLIGQGAFADVYEAIDRNDRRYAVKFLFSAESKISASIREENEIVDDIKSMCEDVAIPKIEYCGNYHRRKVIVMELLGETLDERQQRAISGKFKFKTVYQIGYQMLKVLEHVHKAGYLHADISPRNMMIKYGQNEDQVYLIDFGCSLKATILQKEVKFKPGTNLTKLYASHPIADLELLGYTMIWMAKKSFPWDDTWKTSLVTEGGITGPKGKKFRKKICEGIPDMDKFFETIDGMKLTSYPDYIMLKELFERIVQTKWNCSVTDPIDWTGPKNRSEGFFKHRSSDRQ